MTTFTNDLKTIQDTVNDAYSSCSRILAMIDSNNDDPADIAAALDKMSAQFESGTISLRNLCEKHRPNVSGILAKPLPPTIKLTGRAEVNEYGWLHIELNSLLPHCRYQTPAWLADTISRLLDDYESRGRQLPSYGSAMLVIDEYCDIDSRMVYDQDNKGWKAIPNALKGRVIRDDDQFSLSVSLISKRSNEPSCHIYLFPMQDAGDFFSMREWDYPIFR